jgi:hypothetical protein
MSKDKISISPVLFFLTSQSMKINLIKMMENSQLKFEIYLKKSQNYKLLVCHFIQLLP